MRARAARPRQHSTGIDLPLADGWPLVAASPVPYGPFSAVPAELAGRDGRRFATLSSRRRRAAEELGVDVLELDMAHGYLLGELPSPLTNPREDDGFASRSRFSTAVRAVWPRALAVRLSVTDWHPRGNTVERRNGRSRGALAGTRPPTSIHVEAGQTVHDDRPEYRRGFLTALSDRVRNEARVPTLVRGHS